MRVKHLIGPDSVERNREESEFRTDINGLRAWAVIAVVLYHFDLPGLQGGFSGVDVFFVISGFLMCSIVVDGIEAGTFSIWRFYLARARRIVPALIVLCIAVLVTGWFLLMPKEYMDLGRHVRESVLFSSNLRYLAEAGYFDVASNEKWLLHTWSLSVEWQFYLLFPLVLVALWRFLPTALVRVWVLTLLLGASLLWSAWLTGVTPNEAFYVLQARAWEMLAGALVFLLFRNRRFSAGQAAFLEKLGLGLIIAGFLLLDAAVGWPGWLAVCPVLGAMLVIGARNVGSAWTGNALAQWIGTRSYSIYLWHWPLVVLLAYFEYRTDRLWVAAAIGMSIVLGHASYRWVEVPGRRLLFQLPARRAAAALVIPVIALAFLAQQVRRDGFPDRLPADIALVADERQNKNPRLEECLGASGGCVYGSEPIRAILIGDSHADAVVTALQASLGNDGGVYFKGASGCPVVFGIRATGERKGCERFVEGIRSEHREYPEGVPLVMVGRWSQHVTLDAGARHFKFGDEVQVSGAEFLEEFRTRFIETICEISDMRTVYLMRPIPEMSVDVPAVMGRALLVGKTVDVTVSRSDYFERNSFIISLQDDAVKICGARVLNPLPAFCNEEFCLGSEKGRPLFRDKDHLSEFGNRRLVPVFSEMLNY